MSNIITATGDKIVVVAGAGISKSAPSNLPSWWDYNKLLVETIGEVAAEELGLEDNPLDAAQIVERLHVTTISDYFVNRIAGSTYFKLISLLDGARPNENHLMLASLAKNGVISAIVTTNFDTLIEQAFDIMGVPYKVYVSPTDYNLPSQSDCPIYKIHGSADKPDTAVDTVAQKLAGLSDEKREALKDLFSNNQVLFMGFSGDDFSFGSDYIPVSYCKKEITWISHPGSSFSKRTSEIIREHNIVVREMELKTFYLESGWSVPEVPDAKTRPIRFEEKSRDAIKNLLLQPHIGPENCIGLCMELLDLVGNQADSDEMINRFLSNEQLYSFERKIPLLSQVGRHFRKRGDFEKSKEICLYQLKLIEGQLRLQRWVHTGNPIEDEIVREYSLNKSTVLINLALSYQELHDYDVATDYLSQAFPLAFVARSWENTAHTLYLLAETKRRYLASLRTTSANDLLFCFYSLKAALNIAKNGGVATTIVTAGVALARYCEEWGLLKEFCAIKQDVEQALPLSFVDRDAFANVMSVLDTNIRGKQANEFDPIEMCLLVDIKDNWEHYGQRPLLCYEEGLRAKEICESDTIDELLEYMDTVIEESISKGRLDLADAMLESEVGVVLERANQFIQDGFAEKGVQEDHRALELLVRSMPIEMKLNRVDRLAQTLGMMTQIDGNIQFYTSDQRLFLAELVLCIGFDERFTWLMCHAAKVAASTSFEMGLFAKSKKYCERFFEMTGNNTNATGEANIRSVEELYNRLIER